MNLPKKIRVYPQPNGDGLQVTYERNMSRKLHHLPAIREDSEQAPHGAGSFHDPEQHMKLMDRVTRYLTGETDPS